MQDITETATHFDNLRALFDNIIMATMIISVPLTKVGTSKCLQRLSFCGTKLLILYLTVFPVHMIACGFLWIKKPKTSFALGWVGMREHFVPFAPPLRLTNTRTRARHATPGDHLRVKIPHAHVMLLTSVNFPPAARVPAAPTGHPIMTALRRALLAAAILVNLSLGPVQCACRRC